MNELIRKAVSLIEAQIPKDETNAHQKIVVSGLRLMSNDKIHSAGMEMLQNDPVEGVAKGAAAIIAILYNKSKGTKPPLKIYMRAAIVLALKIMDNAEGIGELQITPETIAEVTKLAVQRVMEKFGIGKDTMDKLTAKGQEYSQDQTVMARYNQARGGDSNTAGMPAASEMPTAPGGLIATQGV